MKKAFAVIMFLVVVFSFFSPLYADQETVKIFTSTNQNYSLDSAAMAIENMVNKWLSKNKDIVIMQRCMSISQSSNQTRIAISIFYKISKWNLPSNVFLPVVIMRLAFFSKFQFLLQIKNNYHYLKYKIIKSHIFH